MEPWAIALFLKPFAYLAVFVALIWPVTWAVRRYMPDGKIKRLLLRRWGE